MGFDRFVADWVTDIQVQEIFRLIENFVVEFNVALVDFVVLEKVGNSLQAKSIIHLAQGVNNIISIVLFHFLVKHQKCNKSPQHEALLEGKQVFTDIRVNVYNAPIIFLPLILLPYHADQISNLVHLLTDALNMLSLGVEYNLLLKVVSVDVDILIQICFSEEYSYSIFHSKVELQIISQVKNLSHSVDHNVFFGLET